MDDKRRVGGMDDVTLEALRHEALMVDALTKSISADYAAHPQEPHPERKISGEELFGEWTYFFMTLFLVLFFLGMCSQTT